MVRKSKEENSEAQCLRDRLALLLEQVRDAEQLCCRRIVVAIVVVAEIVVEIVLQLLFCFHLWMRVCTKFDCVVLWIRSPSSRAELMSSAVLEKEASASCSTKILKQGTTSNYALLSMVVLMYLRC